jgi:hypothetical protein
VIQNSGKGNRRIISTAKNGYNQNGMGGLDGGEDFG